MPLYLTYFVLYFFIFMAGACIGSFLNVVIYRLPKKLTVVYGHSFCPHCGKPVAFYDRIPIFSYIWLMGRCRRCKGTIATRYLVIELMTGLLALLSAIYYNFSPASILTFLVGCTLICIAYIDQDTQSIPNSLVAIILGLGILSKLIFLDANIKNSIIGALIVAIPLGGLSIAFKAFGMGDVKLVFACGLLLEFPNIIVAFLISLVLGAAVAAILLSKQVKEKRMPFAPYLCIGCFVALLFGKQLVVWYLKLLGGL